MKVTRVFSFGGGVQSVAVLVLQALGKVNFDDYIYADVGEDSEHPDTIEYMNKYAIPFATEAGIKINKAQKTRYGNPDTVLMSAIRENRSVPIPVYMPTGAPGNRSCTADFKIKVVDSYVRKAGYKNVVMGIGFTIDENRRAVSKPKGWHSNHLSYKFGYNKVFEFPLLRFMLSRRDCENIIRAVGLPVPSSSACWFCPFRTRAYWYRLKRQRPDLFDKAKSLEERINKKRGHTGGDKVYLHKDGVALSELPDQPSFFDLDGFACESGYCGL